MELIVVSTKTAVGVMCAVVLGSVIHSEYRMNKIENKIDRIEDQIVKSNEKIAYTQHDVDCLTKNIYYEAGVEHRTGKYAVANITVNRVKAGNWGNNVCKVVYAKKQFSWTLSANLPKPNKQLWAESHAIAMDTLANGARVKGLEKSLFYHADYVNPKWVEAEAHAMTIGRHKFYDRAKNTNIYI